LVIFEFSSSYDGLYFLYIFYKQQKTFSWKIHIPHKFIQKIVIFVTKQFSKFYSNQIYIILITPNNESISPQQIQPRPPKRSNRAANLLRHNRFPPFPIHNKQILISNIVLARGTWVSDIIYTDGEYV
jgi:hypothetical protein